MLELAHQGAQVMQVRAVELGWVNDVVIEVLSSFEEAPGTLIKEDPLVEQRNKVRGIAHDRNVAKVTLVAVPDRPGVARAVFAPLAEQGISVDMIVQNVGHGGATDMSFTVPRGELAKAKRVLEPIVRELGFREMTTDASIAKVSIVGAGLHNAPGYAARMFGTLADAGVNIEMISTSEVRITCTIAEDQLEAAATALHAAFALSEPDRSRRPRDAGCRRTAGRRRGDPAGRGDARAGRLTAAGAALPRQAGALRPGRVHPGRGPRLAGRRAARRSASRSPTSRPTGRGRSGRTWIAPPGRALLLSLGFRPTWLAPGHAWRLAATVSLAMADAAEEAAGLRDRAIRLKWPNDLVIEDVVPDVPRRRVRALAASASWAASWASPTGSGRPRRAWWSGSASTPTGRPTASRPTWRRR